jgi:hypothetical protein
MDPTKQKKKPAVKLEQIIIPEKEKKPSVNPEIQQVEPPITKSVGSIVLDTVVNGVGPIVVNPTPAVKQLKKRGRKRKIPIDEKYTNPEYIVMWPEICMAQKVLIDRYDNVYTYDLNSPQWLGVKTVYGKIDNTTYTAPLTKYYFQ